MAYILASSFADLFRAEFGLRQAEVTSLLADLYGAGLLPVDRVRVAEHSGEVVGVMVISFTGRPRSDRGWLRRAWPVFRKRTGWKGALRAAIGSSLLRYYFAGRTPAGRGAYIDSLAVEEGSRRQGIGRALIRAGSEEARTAGCPHIGLHVLRSKEHARRLYEAEGFFGAGEGWWLARVSDRVTLAMEKVTRRPRNDQRSILMVKQL